MKILFKSLAILACSALFLSPVSLRAQDDSGDGDSQDVSFQTFYDQLGDQGAWVQTDDYGYVFQPNVNNPDWEPYSDGYWVNTDAGFTWVSDEPWGWATYHYGRWANIDGLGWVWVPGYRWAPAWVSWRYGGGYCGWAPLPPETLYGAEYGEPGVHVSFGFHFGGDVDVGFHIGPGWYNFVRVEDMGERNYRHHIINRENNYTIINNTTNITNINVNNNGGTNGGAPRQFHGIVANGPPVNDINAHARQRIPTVQLATSNQPGKSNLQGNTLAVFAPRVNPNSRNEAKPSAVTQTLNRPTFNRGDSISKPLMVTRNVQAPPPSPDAIRAAEQAQAAAPDRAKIATPKTPIRTMATQPVTSLTPVVHTNPGTQNFNNVNPNGEHHAGGAVNTPGNQPNVIHNNPPQTFHPQTQPENQGNPNVIHNNPPQTFHPQTQPPPPVHTENPGNNGGFHPQNQGGGNGGGQNHPSGGGGQGGGHPSGNGGGNDKDKDKKP